MPPQSTGRRQTREIRKGSMAKTTPAGEVNHRGKGQETGLSIASREFNENHKSQIQVTKEVAGLSHQGPVKPS